MAAWKLDGRSALITGAARGIGLGTAQGLAARGVRVAMLDIDGPALEAAAARVPNAQSFVADVTDDAAMRSAVAAAVEAFGGLDIVVANAGMAPLGTLRHIDPRVFERTIEVNLLGVWRTIRHTLPHVIDRRGYVLPVASLAAALPAPALASYAPSKAAVESLANVLRVEVAHLGVDVGCAYFGFMDTDMVRGSEEHPLYKRLRAGIREPIGKTYPLSKAVDAMTRGVERRARLVYAPGWVRAMIALRTMMLRAAERDARGLMPEADALFEAKLREGAEQSAFVSGPGGEAAMRGAPPYSS